MRTGKELGKVVVAISITVASCKGIRRVVKVILLPAVRQPIAVGVPVAYFDFKHRESVANVSRIVQVNYIESVTGHI